MRQPVDDILAERGARSNRRRRLVAGSTAFIAHALLGAAVALAPVFVARSQAQEREYVRVMIVPAKALGQSAAPAERAPARQKPAPIAAPTAAVPTPQKAPMPDKTEAEVPPPRSGGEASQDSETTEASSADSSPRRGGLDGTSLGISPFGSSEASLDDPDFRYGYYIQQMLAIIGGHWVRPRAGFDTEVVVHYNIGRSGRLSDIEIVRESGNRAFDAAGLRAVTLASPLPPLPQSYPHDSLGVTLLIR